MWCCMLWCCVLQCAGVCCGVLHCTTVYCITAQYVQLQLAMQSKKVHMQCRQNPAAIVGAIQQLGCGLRSASGRCRDRLLSTKERGPCLLY